VRRRTGGLVGEIDRAADVADSVDAGLLVAVAEDEMAPAARTAVRAADARKGVDPVVLRVSNVSYITTFMVVVTGRNAPQIRAIANLVEEDLLKVHRLKPRRRSRAATSGWILLDYGDLMVHVFLPEQRIQYNMEGLWHKGEPLDISDCLAEPEARPVEGPAAGEGEDDDWL
jgi:ribosome-associated protein